MASITKERYSTHCILKAEATRIRYDKESYSIWLDKQMDKLYQERASKAKKLSETRSKVCRLGNRLSKTMSRKEAFRAAWELVLAGQVSLKVAGVTFGNRQEALRRLASYNPADVVVSLTPEPKNPHDPQAVAVMVGIKGGKGLYALGYVSRDQTDTAHALLGKQPRLQVMNGDVLGARVSFPL